VDLAYSALPDDVEIVENERGQFETRSSDRDVRIARPQPTPELTRVACLTYLNVRAVMERIDVDLGMTREQYERACDLVGVMRLPDVVCATMRKKRFEAPEHDAETIVTCELAKRRSSGIFAEDRRQRRDFAADLELLPGFSVRGLSREQYEKTCAWIGADPAPDDQIEDLKVEYYRQEEIADLVDLPLVLANWRFTGMVKERRERS
jgi:hypothetical protein